MKLAYILMVHKHPHQVERLIKRMSHPSIDFYVHVDAKIDINEFYELKKLPRVHFTGVRKKINWASYSWTEALIEISDELLKSDNSYDFISVLSGQDYPIKPIEEFITYLESNKNKSFLLYEGQGGYWWSHAHTRVENYHMTDYSFKGKYLVQYLLNLILPKRKFPYFDKLYGAGGAGWWIMNRACVQYVVEFMKQHEKLHKFMKLTWGSDEFIFQTILLNSDLKEQVVNENWVYNDWSEGKANPKLLRKEDLKQILNSNKFFARKFDQEIDEEILDLIDKEVHLVHN